MTLQMAGTIKYAPSRDVAYVFPELVTIVADNLDRLSYPPLHAWLDREGITLEDVAQGLDAYVKFVTMGAATVKESIFGAAKKSGWEELPWQVKIAVMFHMGGVVTGLFYKGIRDHLQDVENPERDYLPLEKMRHAAAEYYIYISLPIWKRWLYRKSNWYRTRVRRSFVPDVD